MSRPQTSPSPHPAGVLFVQVGGQRGRIALVVADAPFEQARALVATDERVNLIGVVHGRRSMLRLIRARLERHGDSSGTYRRSAALDELRAQWRAGNVLWLAGVGDTTDAHERMRDLATAQLLAEPDGAPWQTRRRPRPRAAVDQTTLPDDLPDRLHGAVDAVLEILDRTARARGATIIPTRLAVGRALAAYPNHDHVREAQDLEHYLVHGGGQRVTAKDVVQRYRGQLDRRPAVYQRAEQPAAEPMRRTKAPTAKGDL